MDYKRRSSRNNTEAQGSKKGVLFALVSVAMIAIIFLATVGKSCSCDAVGKLFGNDKKDQNAKITDTISQQEQTLLSPSPSTAASENTLVLESRVFYILQMGQYNDRSSADAQSILIKPMGAAGYVHTEGGLYRVFAAVYADEKSLQKVLDQVRAEGHEASSYIKATDELTISIVGNVEQNECLIKSVKLVNNLYDDLYEMSIAFDKGELTPIQCKAKISRLKMDIESAMSEIILNDSANVQLVMGYINDCIEILSTFESIDGTISTGEFSASIKALNFNIINSYMSFINNVNGGMQNETG